MENPIRSSALRLRWLVAGAFALLLLPFLASQVGLPGAGIHVEYRAGGSGLAACLGAAGTTLLLGFALLRLTQALARSLEQTREIEAEIGEFV